MLEMVYYYSALEAIFGEKWYVHTNWRTYKVVVYFKIVSQYIDNKNYSGGESIQRY